MKEKLLFFILLIFTVSSCNNDDPIQIPARDDRFTEFSIKFDQAGDIVDFPGTIDTETGNVTIEIKNNKWITNLDDAVAEFTTTGRVTIDDTEQISGITSNNFSNSLKYTIIDKGGRKRTYTIQVVCPQLSGLPVININTEDGKDVTDKENYLTADFVLIDREHPENNIEKQTGIRGRGNSTWAYDKKPYRLKFDKKTSLFGLGAAKSWVLLANYLDPTFIMNTIAFELGHRLEIPFTNHANHVEVFLNNKYRGSYVLTEQVQVNEHRVNIDEEKDFFVELDSYFDEDIKFKSDILQLPVNIKSPEVDNISEVEFVRTAINELEKLMFDPASGFPHNNYLNLIDLNSLVNYILVQEILANPEIRHPKSTYLYKEEGKKIMMGPLWDFDWGFGYREHGQEYFSNPTRLMFSSQMATDWIGDRFFSRFFEDPVFVSAYKKRWNEVKDRVAAIEAFIEAHEEYLEKSAIENNKLWSHNLEFTEQIREMKTWMKARINALDTHINNL